MFPMARVIQENLKDLRDSWLGFVVLGMVLLLLGTVALVYAAIATEVAVLVFGFILLVGGVLYLAGAFVTRGWGGFFLSLLAGVLYLAAGFILLNHPAEAAIVYTLILAVFFFVEGLFRIVAAVIARFRHWPVVLLNGLVSVLLGVLIWREWPLSGLYLIGLFLGINLIFSGAAYLALGLNVRKLPV
jgi:uncharacterized membrane protein HdeD (DUF308 family)